MITAIKTFMRDEQGVVAIEYALVAAGMAAVVYAVFVATPSPVKDLLNTLIGKISTAAGV